MSTTASSSFTLCQYIVKDDEEDCQEEQYSLCPHCKLWLCAPHIAEHQQIVQMNAHALNDHANQVRQQLTELSTDHLYEDYKKKIAEWQAQMHAEVDSCHAEMLQQLTNLHNELTEEVKEFKKKKTNLFMPEITEPLTHMFTKQKQIHPNRLKTIETHLQSLEQQIADIQNPDIIHLNCDEVQLTGQVGFKRKHPCDETNAPSKNSQSLELEVFKQEAAHHFPLKTNSSALGTSTHFILAFEGPSTLLLFDMKTQLRSIETTQTHVYDIYWSDTINQFLVAGEKLQTYDVMSNELVNRVLDLPEDDSQIWSVTSYFHDMLLLYNDHTVERYSWPSFTRKNRWLRIVYLEKENDLGSSHIRFNSTGMLAISIKQKDFHWRIDLFDAQLRRTHRSVPLASNGTKDFWDVTFTSVINDEWLVMDRSSNPRMLLLLDKNGTLKQQVQTVVLNSALMGREFLVLHDFTGISLFKLS